MVEVYFDVVFYLLLIENMFKWEGYYLVFIDKENLIGELKFIGVVYNEMNGVFFDFE